MKHRIGYEIKTLDNMIERIIISKHKKCNLKEKMITPMQAKIVEYLINNNKKIVYQNDIEKEFKLRRSTISGILQTMEKNELIIRLDSKDDARKKEIILSEDCKLNVKKISSKMIEFDKLLKKDISNEDLNIFFSVIEKIKENISNEYI